MYNLIMTFISNSRGNYFAIEIILSIISVTMLIFCTFMNTHRYKIINIALSLIVGLIIFEYIHLTESIKILSPGQPFFSALHEFFAFSNDQFFNFAVLLSSKLLVVLLSFSSIIFYINHNKISNQEVNAEFITLILLSTVGSCISISAENYLVLFCGLELQSIPSYALSASKIKDLKSSEAGIKYFIPSALMSCMMLFGISFIYGFSGSIEFAKMNTAFGLVDNHSNIGLMVGMIFVLASMLFRLSIAPFHFWTADVYEGSPISAVVYFVSQKLPIMIILTKLLLTSCDFSYPIVKYTAILSMVVGAFGGINQTSLKRLIGYSTILNMGFASVGLCLYFAEYGYFLPLLYVFVYAISTIAFLSCISAIFGEKADSATFSDLEGIATSRKTLAAGISILMFSFIGLPPLAGFFIKYYILYSAIKFDEFSLTISILLCTLVSSIYYLKIVKSLYFVKPREQITPIATNSGLLFISIIPILFVLLFMVVNMNL